MKLNYEAKSHIHFEMDISQNEVEIYIGGWFLSSVQLSDISPQAKEILFN